MIKVLHENRLSTMLDIKTNDGKQIFRGEVVIHDGSFINTDNAKVRITEDHINNRYICEVEVR